MKMSFEIKKIAVIGAGTMGHGIAELAAIAGYKVSVVDISDEILKNALSKIQWSLSKLHEKGQIKENVETILSRISLTTNLIEAVKDADFVIEAIIEKLDEKKRVFSLMDQHAPSHTILATNTSSLPITEIADATKRPDKVVGMHFFNPPVLMPLVEIIRGKDTSDFTVHVTNDLAKKFGKQTVIVNKDIPGFVVNRILARIFNSACNIVMDGKADIIEVDSTARYKLGFPMGIFELADYSGIDIFYYVSQVLIERGFKVHGCNLFIEKFKAGEYGVKTGKGFYVYPAPGKFVKPELPKEKSEKLNPLYIIAPAINEASWMLREGIARKEDIDKACKLGLGYPKGLFEYADEFGIDNVVKILEEVKREKGWEEYSPDPLLIQMVNEGRIGVRSGKGFYEYGKVEERKLSTIILRIEEPIAWIYLNRPERLNALNMEMIKELSQVLDELELNDKVRVLIITGTGRAFSAGADITAFQGVTPFLGAVYVRRFQELFNKIELYTKPVIAALNGYTLGGGLELSMACDFRIASELAELGQPEINLGLIPGAGGTQRLPRLIGEGKAKEIIYTGERIPAKEALNLGLVNKVVPHDELLNEARRFALKLSEKPPLALLAAKYAVKFGLESNLWSGLALESSLFGLLFSTEDFIEGVSAFLEKRKPKFKGK
jgi:enoyl-CoA hydratase/3-hydroxyacyl-CoA dehydrogenase